MEPTAVSTNYAGLLPEGALLVATFLLAGLAALRSGIDQKVIGYSALAALTVTGVLVGITGFGSIDGTLFVNEPCSQFFKFIFLAAAFFAIAQKFSYSNEKRPLAAAKILLLFLSVMAMMFLSMSSNLLSIFVSLELSAVPLIAMTMNYGNSVKLSQKFLLITLFSSLLLLFGFSFLYGLSGATNLIMMKLQIAVVHITQRQIGVIILLAIASILSGLMLKAGFIPFNFWMHQIHKNLPLPMVGFVAVAFTSAVILAFAKIFINGLFAFHGPEMNPNDWGRLVAFIAFINIVFGTIQMMRQRDIVSLMFYANMAQMGFVLMGMISMVLHGLQSAGFYLISFLFSATGGYALIDMVRRQTNSTDFNDFKGLSKSSLPLAILFSIYLMSLAGFPLLAGFVAKFSVISAALEMAGLDKSYHWMYLLAGAGIICAALALIKLGKMVLSLFARTEQPPLAVQISPLLKIVLAVTAMGTILFGVFPDPLLALAARIPEAFGFIIE